MSTNYRKFIAGTVSAAVVASAIAPVASAASFSDVDANSVHAKAIDALSETGIIKGYEDGTFKPGKSITRGQAAKMIARTIEGEGEVEQVFDDVPVTADEELVKAAYEVFTAGAMTGSNGKLMPNKEITRQQMAKVLVEAFGLEHSDAFENNLKDLDTAYPDFQDYIEILVENGITQVADGNFRPLEKVSRAQFASFVYRALQVEPAVPAVESVEAINAKQVEVKFATPVSVNTIMDEDGVLTDAIAIDTVANANAVDLSKAKAELSEDGTSLVITAAGEATFKGKYAVTITGVKDIDGNEVESFAGFFTAEDTTRPVIEGVEYIDVNTAKIVLSEPVAAAGSVTVNNEDATVDFTAGDNFITVDLTDVEEKDEVEVTIVGAKDFAGNYVSPNPVKVTVEKQETDKVAPEVKSVQVLSDTKAKVTFSEAVVNPAFSINGTAAAKVEADEDGVTYTVTHNFADGVNKIDIKNIVDKAGNKAEDFTKQVIVAVDTTAPELVDQEVVKDEDGKEVLVLTYDEEVTVSGDAVTFEGAHVVDYVTSTKKFTATPVVDEEDAKVVKVPLQDAVKGKWTVTLAEGFVTDTAKLKNKSEAEEIAFVRGEDDEEIEEQEVVASIVDGDKNAITVNFDGKVDGASAVDVDNYAIEGVEVEKAVLTANTEEGATVELTLAEGSVKASGNYELTISGVKAADGTAVEEVSGDVALVENVLPVLETAKLVSGTEIVLTFSENMTAASIEEATTPVADFEVFVGDEKVTVATEAVGANAKEVKLTLGTALTSQQLAKAITIKPAAGFEVTDAAGNAHASFEVAEVTKAIN
jgi:hypothetical protein